MTTPTRPYRKGLVRPPRRYGFSALGAGGAGPETRTSGYLACGRARARRLPRPRGRHRRRPAGVRRVHRGVAELRAHRCVSARGALAARCRDDRLVEHAARRRSLRAATPSAEGAPAAPIVIPARA